MGQLGQRGVVRLDKAPLLASVIVARRGSFERGSAFARTAQASLVSRCSLGLPAGNYDARFTRDPKNTGLRHTLDRHNLRGEIGACSSRRECGPYIMSQLRMTPSRAQGMIVRVTSLGPSVFSLSST